MFHTEQCPNYGSPSKKENTCTAQNNNGKIFTRTIESRRNNLVVKRSFPDYLDEKNKNGCTEPNTCGHDTKNVKRHHNSVPFRHYFPNTQQRSDSTSSNSNAGHQTTVIYKKKHHNNYGFPIYWRRFNSLEVPNLQYPSPFFIHRLAPDKFMMRSHLVQVKEIPENLITGSIWDKMSCEVWDIFFNSQQSEDMFKKKMNLWKFLYVTIKSMFPKYSLYLTGSTISGFGTQHSDMDLCMLVKLLPLDIRFQALNHLSNIQQFIKNTNMFIDIELIKAKVPILKFKDHQNHIEIDLNCNNTVGIRNTHLLYCYSQLDWRVRPLVLNVKLWARHNNINDPRNRTISSYSLVLMVIHYLQYGVTPPVLPCLQKEMPEKFNSGIDIYQIDLCEQMPKFVSANTNSLGELFCGFFTYYANFQYEKFVISVRTGQVIKIEECKTIKGDLFEAHEWKFLCIEEPFDLSNTARSVYDAEIFSHIMEVFRKTSEALRNCVSMKDIIPINLSRKV